MQSNYYISALAAASLLALGAHASAQTLNSPGTAGTVITPSSGAVGGISSNPGAATGTGTSTTGVGSGVGGPPSSLPSSATSLPGSNPSAPGFPGRVGQ